MISRDNNFGFLRMLAASLVVLAHVYQFLGIKDPINRYFPEIDLGVLGVYIFFIVSGYLCTQSLYGSKNLYHYSAKRALRIIPAYYISILWCAFVIGPFFTELSLTAYLSDPGTFRYVIGNMLFWTVYTLPGVFVGEPLLDFIDGPYWTLPAEVSMYMLLTLRLAAQDLMRGSVKQGLAWNLGWLIIIPFAGMAIYQVGSLTFIHLAFFFFSGSIIYKHRYRLLTKKLFGLCASIFFIGLLVPSLFWMSQMILPMVVLYLANKPTRLTANWESRFGDYSYGIYLFHAPTQQVIRHTVGAPDSVLLFFILSMALTLPLAYASWRYIEKPALRLKRKLTSASAVD